jgi:hypothetical protein
VKEPAELDEDGNVIERVPELGDAPGPYVLDEAMAAQAIARRQARGDRRCRRQRRRRRRRRTDRERRDLPLPPLTRRGPTRRPRPTRTPPRPPRTADEQRRAQAEARARKAAERAADDAARDAGADDRDGGGAGMSDLDVREQLLQGTAPGEGLAIELVGDGDLVTADMSLSIGPAHPATHGVFRVVFEMDGERIVRAKPVIGYMHRGFEKLAEYRDYRQIMALVNRHDWLSGFSNELGVALAVEQMLEMEVPERAQWIRMLMAEWNRILNHLMFIGSFALELGAITPMFYAFREREDIQR